MKSPRRSASDSALLPPPAIRERERQKMFPGMFARKPDKKAALNQLRTHVAMFGVMVAAVRVTPYLLHFLSNEKEELTLAL